MGKGKEARRHYQEKLQQEDGRNTEWRRANRRKRDKVAKIKANDILLIKCLKCRGRYWIAIDEHSRGVEFSRDSFDYNLIRFLPKDYFHPRRQHRVVCPYCGMTYDLDKSYNVNVRYAHRLRRRIYGA